MSCCPLGIREEITWRLGLLSQYYGMWFDKSDFVETLDLQSERTTNG